MLIDVVDGLDFLAGMGQDNVKEFGAALEGEAALRAWLETESEGMQDGTVEGLIEAKPAFGDATTASCGGTSRDTSSQ